MKRPKATRSVKSVTMQTNRTSSKPNTSSSVILSLLCSLLLLLLLATTATTLIRADDSSAGNDGNYNHNDDNDDPIAMGLMQTVIDSSESYMASSGSMAASADIRSSGSKGLIQCEPIRLDFCSKLAYKSTRLPNYFGDKNQFEVIERSAPYKKLIESHCSAHLLTYICELLVPICMPNNVETMKRFDIYPCRTLCRRVKQDCDSELMQLNSYLFSKGSNQDLAGFDCDQLPYEANGGDGRSLYGPCHDLPPATGALLNSAAAAAAANGSSNVSHLSSAKSHTYQEFQPSFDANVPPFITDTSPLDLGALGAAADRPRLAPPPRPSGASHAQATPAATSGGGASDLLHQVQTGATSALALLARYSNLLSVALLVCLLLVLNTKRIGSIGARLCAFRAVSGASAGGVIVVGNQATAAAAAATLGEPHQLPHHAQTRRRGRRSRSSPCWFWPIGRSSSSSSSASSQRKLTAGSGAGAHMSTSGVCASGASYPPIESASAALAALRRNHKQQQQQLMSPSPSLMMIASSMSTKRAGSGCTHQVVGKAEQLLSGAQMGCCDQSSASQKLLAELSAQSTPKTQTTLINVGTCGGGGGGATGNCGTANCSLERRSLRQLNSYLGKQVNANATSSELPYPISTLASACSSANSTNHYDYIRLESGHQTGAQMNSSECERDQLVAGFGNGFAANTFGPNSNNSNNSSSNNHNNNTNPTSSPSVASSRNYLLGSAAPYWHQPSSISTPTGARCHVNERAPAQRMYSNILLSSPSHSVLLFNGARAQQTNNGNNHNHIGDNQYSQPTATGASAVQRLALSSASSPPLPPPPPPPPPQQQQRSLPRRPSRSSRERRGRPTGAATATATANRQDTGAQVLASASSRSAESSGSSSTSQSAHSPLGQAASRAARK